MYIATLPASCLDSARVRAACMLLFFMSAVVVADSVDRFESGSTHDERVKEEIYEQGIDWRVPESDPEDEWRAAQRQAEQEQSSQWRFGADPAYEQMRNQNRDAFRDPAEIGGARPSGQIRFSW